MKKILVMTFLATLSLFANASSDVEVKPGEVEKKGFLATEWCIKEGYLKDCILDSMQDSKPALFVHSEGMTYKLEMAGVPMAEIDEGIGKNNVTIIGTLVGDTIKVRGYKAPPPEAKSFFKGCL